MFLSEEQRTAYREEGYLVYGRLLSPAQLEFLKYRYVKVYDGLRTSGTLHNVAVQTNDASANTSRAPENLQVHYMCHHDDGILSFLYSKKLLDLVQDFIGPNIRLFFEQGFWKPPFQGAATNWHQDNGYFKLLDSSSGVGCWIALDDVTKDNGCMWVVPGSHRESYEHYCDLTTDHLLRTDVQEEHAVPIELKAGQCLFFEFGTLHQTKTNTTSSHRRALAIHFSKTDAVSSEPTWLQREKKFIPILRGRGCTDGVEEFGISFAGNWDKEFVSQASTAP